MRAKLVIVLGLMFGLVGVAQAQGDAAAGEKKAATCLGCHGVEGYRNAYPSYHVPMLGGQKAQYLVSALQAYKSGQRQHATMQAQAAGLSEQDMQDLAAYFAGAASQGSNGEQQ